VWTLLRFFTQSWRRHSAKTHASVRNSCQRIRKVTMTPTTVPEVMGRIALGNYILVRNVK
jgi:hypothetical protein